MVFFLTLDFFLKRKKKCRPKFKKAIAIRTFLKTNSKIDINDERISLMMGKKCHLVIYPINKKKGAKSSLYCKSEKIRSEQY